MAPPGMGGMAPPGTGGMPAPGVATSAGFSMGGDIGSLNLEEFTPMVASPGTPGVELVPGAAPIPPAAGRAVVNLKRRMKWVLLSIHISPLALPRLATSVGAGVPDAAESIAIALSWS